MGYGITPESLLSLTTAFVCIMVMACVINASDLELGGGFHRVLLFPPHLQLACHDLRTN